MRDDAAIWWRQAVVYEVYVRSFADGNGDGVGDLPGIRARLPYLAGLGVDAVWLTPFYPSPMHDHGYDVSDPTHVEPTFGTLADLDALVAEAHELGLRLIIDIVPNHTSWDHPWFRQAIADPHSPMRDRYLFRDRKADGSLPNNWRSEFGGAAWSPVPGTAEPDGEQVYLHLFAPEQPDLNWRNPAVHAYWEGVLRFWLDRGVDGFRIDVAHGLYKDQDLSDNSRPENMTAVTHQQTNAGTENSQNQPEVHAVYARWREICDSYPGDRMMVGEVFLYDLPAVAGYVGPHNLQQAFNFLVMGQPFAAAALQKVAAEALEAFEGRDTLPTWVLSNHDLIRHATRYGGGDLGRQRGLAATAYLLGLPGSPYLFQGEEFGCEEVVIPPDLRQDPIWARSGRTEVGRDGCRTPIPWSAELPGHEFTTGEHTWLPFAPDAGTRNIAGQQTDPGSTYSAYRLFLGLRRELRPRLAESVSWLDALPKTVSAYVRRSTQAGPDLLVALNTGDTEAGLELPTGRTRLLASTRPTAAPAGGRLVLPARTTAWLMTSSSGR